MTLVMPFCGFLLRTKGPWMFFFHIREAKFRASYIQISLEYVRTATIGIFSLNKGWIE